MGKEKTVFDFDLDFETRTWTGSIEQGSITLSGAFTFLGKGGRKLDISYDAPSLAAVEGFFGDTASDLLLEKKGVDSDVTADVTFYQLIFKLSKNRKKARFKGKYRIDYTVVDNGDTLKGLVKLPLKGAVARENP